MVEVKQIRKKATQKIAKINQKSGESNSNSGKSENEITIMSMKYRSSSKIKENEWIDLKDNVEKIYTSWEIIQNDIYTKNQSANDNCKKISEKFDNLLSDTIEKNDNKFMDDSVELYKKIVEISEILGYPENKLIKLKIKQYIFESYFDVLNNNWEEAEKHVNTAIKILDNSKYINEKINIVLSKLLNSIKQKDEAVFLVKYSDTVNELNYIEF